MYYKKILTSQSGQFEVMHLGQRDHEGERLLLDVELEEVPAPNDLETGQHNPAHVHMGYQDISSHLIVNGVTIDITFNPNKK